MENTLHTNESLLVEKVSYHFKQPSRYDIIVFYPYGKNGDEVPESMKDQLEIDTTASGDQEEDSELYVKRVFGLPGEKIQIIGNDIYVNDKKIDDPYAKNAMKDGDAGVASARSKKKISPATLFCVSGHLRNLEHHNEWIQR